MTENEISSVPIEVSLIDSIAKAEMRGLAGDIVELAIDAVTDDNFLEAIPVVGTVSRFYRSAVSIRDRIFLRKVLSFLNELSDISSQERQRFASELATDAGTQQKAGAALTLLLDSLDDLDKPRIIGRFYRAALQGKVSFEELRRFCMVVERAFLPDILRLRRLRPGDRVDNVAAPYLHSLGLVTQTGEDYGTVNGIGAETWYEVNELGRRFLSIAFGEG